MRTGVIAAISTPPGKGGVALIRMSGEGALEIAERVFFPISKKRLGDYPPRTQVYGNIVYEGEVIDDAMAAHFPAPHSYTGEETVEFCTHGGRLVTSLVMEALLSAGAIPAEAGEFTRRAFVNGRLSLSAAEAIANVLDAESREQLRLGTVTARDRLSSEISEIRTELTHVLSDIFARIDYPDEDLGELSDSETIAALEAVGTRVKKLRSSYRTGRAITEGVRTVICGKPNAGKSSIYNLLVGEDAAIVTDIAGTTRDVLERSVPLGRVMLRLLDTAGIRVSGGDAVERIGIERSRDAIARAELVIAVFDLSRPMDDEDIEVLEALKSSHGVRLAILNKSDLDQELDTSFTADGFERVIYSSAASGADDLRETLSDIIDTLFTDEMIRTTADPIISSARQHSSLCIAESAIDAAIGAMRAGMPVDAASADIERALGAVGELDGLGVSESVTTDIFSRFCVGK